MKRLLLDTNIYGEMVVDDTLTILIDTYEQKKDLMVYGFTVVRKELRDTPPLKKMLGRNLRVALLSLYDPIVKDHLLIVDEKALQLIAEEYFKQYKQLGGAKSFRVLEKDYLVVACGSQKGMDIVVSNDDASMLSELSLRAYALVNERLKLRSPDFLDYNQFKSLVFEGV